MVKSKEIQQELREEFEKYLEGEEELKELYHKFTKLLGDQFGLKAKRVGGENKIHLSVSDENNAYSILQNYSPKKKELKLIKDFVLLHFGKNREKAVFHFDEIYTSKNSKDPDRVKEEATELYEEYKKYLKTKG